ncbi:hypothetical protein CRUP_013096 [Coryphaenoides rupestris]|nr:hypothetical protein CRUP_013096 [Coryphaenoides rupestris]
MRSTHARMARGLHSGTLRTMDFPSHFEQIFQQLNYQRVHGQLCDCVIMVGSRHFKAHRSVLAACSTHFRALFTVTEGDTSMNMIQLDSEVVTAEAFAALVDLMYTSTLVLAEQAASFPIRRFHKRKPTLILGQSDDRPRQRPRPSVPTRGLLGEAADREEGSLLSPDSHKMGEESAEVAGLARASQDDAQMPSQSDSVHCEGEESGRMQGGVGKEEYKEEGELRDNRAEAKIMSKTEEEEEALEEKVVVKCEPLSSPEPTDETSYVTSHAEGGDPAGRGGQDEEEKLEPSPESTQSSDHSLSSDPQPRANTMLQPNSHLRLKTGAGGASGIAGGFGGFGCSNGQNGKAGFSVSNFLGHKGTPAWAFTPWRKPRGLRKEPRTLPWGYPGYRHMAPKLANGVGGGGATSVQDPSSSRRVWAGPLLLNDAGGYEGCGGRPTSLPQPQLTRASADVLSSARRPCRSTTCWWWRARGNLLGLWRESAAGCQEVRLFGQFIHGH